MITRSLPFLFLFTVLPMIFGCKTKKALSGGQCATPATVIDLTGLDGCRLLFQLEDGTKLLPAMLPEVDFTLAGGQEVLINYEPVEDGMSVCMAEDQIVNISCLELTKSTVELECLNAESHREALWLKTAVVTRNPVQVLKYKYDTDQFAYLFKGDDVYVYDCKGQLICESRGPSLQVCIQKAGLSGRGRVVFQGEGVND